MAAKSHDPLMFRLVYLDLVDEESKRPGVYKVFYVDATKIRVRSIEVVRGEEVEGVNLWLPWTSIRALAEV